MQWYYIENSERKGPVEEGDIARLVSQGSLAPKTPVWSKETGKWQPCSETRLSKLLTPQPKRTSQERTPKEEAPKEQEPEEQTRKEQAPKEQSSMGQTAAKEMNEKHNGGEHLTDEDDEPHFPGLLARGGILWDELGDTPRTRAIAAGAGIVLVLSVVILVWGYVYAFVKVPFPRNRLPKTAAEFCAGRKPTFVINRNAILQATQEQLSSEPVRPYVRYVMENLQEKVKGKLAVCAPINESAMTEEFAAEFKKLRRYYRKQIRKKGEGHYAYLYTSEIETLRSRIEGIAELEKFLASATIVGAISYPGLDTVHAYDHLVAKSGAFVHNEHVDKWIFFADSSGPIVDSAFCKLLTGRDADLSVNRKLHENAHSLVKRRLAAETAEERSAVRTAFHHRWFQTLILWVLSVVALYFLLEYARIVRRKQLPRKETHTVYFATNTTSLLLRWVALIIVGLGGLVLVIGMLTYLLAGKGLDVGFISVLGYVYAVTFPILVGIAAVVLSWSFVLAAECLCFISNCYHVLFLKSYGSVPSDNEEREG